VAFYPGCAAALKSGYQPNTRLVLMLGEKDDWTPPGPCVDLGKQVSAEVNLYADSYHDFDNPSGTVRVRTDVPNGVNPGQGVHVGPNPVAREAAAGAAARGFSVRKPAVAQRFIARAAIKIAATNLDQSATKRSSRPSARSSMPCVFRAAKVWRA
jgi:dienelactone hydrolase